MKIPCPNAQGWFRAKFIWWQHNSSVTRSKFDRHKLAVKYYQIIQISPLTTWLSTRLIYVGALCFISNQFIKFKERILWKIFSRSIIVFFSFAQSCNSCKWQVIQLILSQESWLETVWEFYDIVNKYIGYIINHINKKTVFVSFASCKSSKYSWRMPVRRESSILTASCLLESFNQYINIIHQYIGHIVNDISTRKKFSLPLQVASHPITLDRCLSEGRREGLSDGRIYNIWCLATIYILIYYGAKVVCLSEGRGRRAKWCPKIPILQFFLSLLKKGGSNRCLTEGGGGG